MKIVVMFIMCGLLQGLLTSNAYAERYVFVNGVRMNQDQIMVLQQLACGYIPDGSYWVRLDGVWGYYGNPIPQGQITGNCYGTNNNSNARRRSLSERGLLYSPGEILSD